MAKDKRRLSTLQAMTWAFRNECAQLNLPDRRDPGDRGAGFGMEYVLLQRARLGVSVDTFVGSSSPHIDAETVASAVSRLPASHGGIGMAIYITELARSGLLPDWMPGETPRLVPKDWRHGNQTGRLGRSEVIETYFESFTVIHPRNPKRNVTRKRRINIEYTPCRWTPTREQIASVRAGYLAWWRALDRVRHDLLTGPLLFEIAITDAMPAKEPWALR